jgi:hypothetical protein
MIQLVKSPVEFSENPHGYFLQGIRLSGITTLIKAATGLGVYADASDYAKEYLIPKAGEKGTAVHHAIEQYDKTGEKMTEYDLPLNGHLDVSAQLENYIMLREGYEPVDNEYTVSDNLMYASNIDNVWQEKETGGIYLVDTKTNNLDLYPGGEVALIEYLSWQLSCYAFLFEKQNPTLKVAGLLGNWFRDAQCKQWVIERKPDSLIMELLDVTYEFTEHGFVYDVGDKSRFSCAYCHGEVATQEQSLLPQQLINAIATILEEERAAKVRLDELKEALKNAMIENGVKSWDGGKFTATISKDSIVNTFDTTNFKKDHADLYEEYVRQSVRQGSLTLKLK